MPRLTRSTLSILAPALLALVPRPAAAFPSFYDSNCSACHGTTTAGGVQTCAGCHSHGTHPDSTKSSLNVTGTTDKTSYAPGERVSVTIAGGYRGGWVRAFLYDQNLRELARSTGSVLPGFSAPCCGASLPVTLSAPAPTTPGTYTWWASWYGNQFDATGAFFGANWTPSSNPGHGEERVRTNAFTVVAPAAPAIALNPPALDFGSVTVGTSVSRTTAVGNGGTAPLTVSAIALCAATSAQFTWSPAAPLTVAPGASATLTVTYAAVDASTVSGCLTLASNDPAHPSVSLAVSAAGTVPAAPAIALAPPSLSFGTVTLGGSATLSADVADVGTAPLHVTAITRCAGTSTAFAWSPAAPFTVAAGGRTSLSVTYTPLVTTGDSGCLAIASDDPANPAVRLAVSGNGAAPAAPAIAFSPATLDFGTVVQGTSAQRTAQIQNTGTAPLSVTAVALCSGTSAEFTWSAALPIAVAPGQGAPLTVTYTPTNTDFHMGCLAVSSNDPAKPVANLGVTAQGAAAPAPAVALAPPSLDFATVQVGASATLPVQVQNTGAAPLVVSAVARCSGTSAEFGWSPAAPFTVATGQSATLAVTYAPVDAGADNGCLTLATNDPLRASVSLGLAGTGATAAPFPAIALVPPALDFGQVTQGGSATLTSQVRNTGTGPLAVMAIAACAGTSAEFAWSPQAPFTVAPGGATALAVTYAPTDTGTDTGCLDVTSDDPLSPATRLALSGSGVPQAGGLDIDIAELEVPRTVRVRQPPPVITPRIEVRNASTATGTASATLVGVLGTAEVYRQTIAITGVAPGQEREFSFPPFTVPAPPAGGTEARTIRWTATVEDQDPDVDVATATTVLLLPRTSGDRVSTLSSAPASRPGAGAMRAAD